jgi:hypothetical protein
MPVTLPVVLTAATALLLDAQVTDRPLIAPPFASRIDAEAFTDSPTTIDAEASDTEMDATVVLIGPTPVFSVPPPHEIKMPTAERSSALWRTVDRFGVVCAGAVRAGRGVTAIPKLRVRRPQV